MMRRSIFALVTSVMALAACGTEGGETPSARDDQPELNEQPDPELTFDVGTQADREALFDFLVESTMEWDAFAALADHPTHRAHPAGLDVPAAMEVYRDELLAADSDSAFYYALLKISNARKDRHLRLGPVDGGLTFPDTVGIQESQANTPVEDSRVPRAPVRLRIDYGDLDDPVLFVGDRSVSAAAGAYGAEPGLGHRVLAINGMAVDEYREAVRPYHRYSTEPSFLWWFGFWVPQRSVQFPARFYGEALTLVLDDPEVGEYQVELPYLDPGEIQWEGTGEPSYPGFRQVPEVSDNETFALYLPETDGPELVILQWKGFRRDLPEAMDTLMEFAEAEGLLDHHVVVDATRAGGGSRGSYAVARLQPSPHKGTFGNLMVSEAMVRWVDDQIAGLRSGEISPAVEDDGSWQLEWLEEDVQQAIEAGRRFTNDVPFKGAHAPKWSDGIIEPADVHFRGGLTVWLGPKGGSHLDQFAAQVVDNGLGHVMGMSAGGYSNTWQATEILRFPTTGRPIVTHQWSMGHSIRPNGQIVQYNPAEVHEYFPQTRENYRDYHARLLARTVDRLDLR